jgi:hypothetical protein
MPRIRSLLLSIEVRPAGRLSRCAHNRAHTIPRGQLRFVVKNPGPASPERGYCRRCAIQMLKKAQGDLEELEDQL